MELGLKDKVAVVTGGTSGIGKAIAEGLLKEGCRVVVCSRSQRKCLEAKKDLKNKGYEVLAFPVDVSKTGEIQHFIDDITKYYGCINIWVNNAGIYPKKLLLDMTEEEWDKAINVNLKSVFLGCKLAGNHMRNSKGGAIINAGSFAAFIPTVGNSAYAGSKAAIMNLTRTLAGELAPYNIRVNSYIPGVIETPLTKEVIDHNKKKVLDKIALNRIGKPEEVANAVVFLASDAASYITGTFIEISGGKLCVQDPLNPW